MPHTWRDFVDNDASVLFAFEQNLLRLRRSRAGDQRLWERIEHQLRFAARLTQLYPERRQNWLSLLERVTQTLVARVEGGADLDNAVAEAENALGELHPLAKRLTMHMIGHAHIDMNWLWDWAETIEVCRNTFWTMDRLMDEFPFFRFSQDQAAVYAALEELEPELFRRILARIRSGHWEVTANTWVEGDRNLASGESIVRQIMMARHYLQNKLNVDMTEAAIDWEPDLFGHPATSPQVLVRAGLRWYYFCRGGTTNPHHRLFWWKGIDGSRVLAWNDERLWYLGPVRPESAWDAVDLAATTGVEDYLYVYGVGDHGGGPTRDDLRLIRDMQEWPVFPTIRCSTTREAFQAIEKQVAALEADAPRLPVFEGELNTIFEGCYTSQARIKRAHRRDQHLLGVAERTAAVLDLAGRAGPTAEHWRELLNRAWPKVLFNQFHDILPGSGVPDTTHFALGESQRVQAMGEAVIARALRRLGEQVDTAAAAANAVGQHRLKLLWNPSPWPRRDGFSVRYWNPPKGTTHVAVVDDEGRPLLCQTVGRGVDWDQDFIDVVFIADVPAAGYRVVRLTPLTEKAFQRWRTGHGLPGATHIHYKFGAVGRDGDWASVLTEDGAQHPEAGDERAAGGWVSPGGHMVLENKFLRIEMEPASGAIVRWLDKRTGRERLQGGRIGLLELWQESPRPMSAWEIGSIAGVQRLDTGGDAELVEKGPAFSCVRSRRRFGRYGRSRATVEYRVWAERPHVDVRVDVDWREEGGDDGPSPFLRMRFDTGAVGQPLLCDIPFGALPRTDDGREVPAQKWVQYGWLTVANDGRYGVRAENGTMWLSLLRASYDPDPLPDQGRHELNLRLVCDVGGAGSAARIGFEVNEPSTAFPVTAHDGALPPAGSFFGVEGDTNIVVSTLKPASDGNGWIARLYETEGRVGAATLRFAQSHQDHTSLVVRETNLLEVDEGPGALAVTLQPWQIKTLRLEPRGS